jgi:cysteinyl-tRNA synthetase
MPQLKLYNSLTKKQQIFESLEPGKVKLYNCGPTVYKRPHLGNMRRFLFADFLRRTLELFGYEVRDITNITDVGHLTDDELDTGQDKLEAAAQAQKLTPQAIAEQVTEQYFSDIAALNIKPAHKYPRATAHIADMQDLIGQLIKNDRAWT